MEFCTIAMVTDFDCWHPDHQDVDVAQVVAVAKSNATSVSGLLEKSLPQLAQLGESRWAHVLDDAVMTAKEHRCPEMMQRTAALFRSS
jgi:5'-methylthioadenosine phosphorylase